MALLTSMTAGTGTDGENPLTALISEIKLMLEETGLELKKKMDLHFLQKTMGYMNPATEAEERKKPFHFKNPNRTAYLQTDILAFSDERYQEDDRLLLALSAIEVLPVLSEADQIRVGEKLVESMVQWSHEQHAVATVNAPGILSLQPERGYTVNLKLPVNPVWDAFQEQWPEFSSGAQIAMAKKYKEVDANPTDGSKPWSKRAIFVATPKATGRLIREARVEPS